MKKKIICICVIGFVAILIGVCCLMVLKYVQKEKLHIIKLSNDKKEIIYKESEEVFYNPFMGFAPDADYPEIVGDNTLVYMDMTWAEIEPEEGVYSFENWEEENYFTKWKEEGKKVVFRLICDLPDEYEHCDIPEWLLDQTGDGVFYDTEYGMGYAPNYENQIVIDAHERLIMKLGERYGQDNYFYYIEFGSLGHWGEFHVKSDENLPFIPSEEICQEYLLPYLEAFPNAKFLMRRPYRMAAVNGTGLYNDMIGAQEDTKEWLDWIENGGCYEESIEPLSYQKMPEQFRDHPVGGEFTSSIPMEDMLTGRGLDTTLSLLKQSHTTFIGPKIPNQYVDEEEEEEHKGENNNQVGRLYIYGMQEVQKTIGYRIGVREAAFWKDENTDQLTVELLMNNQGVAPFYEDWPICLYLYDAKGNQIERVEADLSLQDLIPGKKEGKTLDLTFESELQKDERYKIYVGMEDPSTGIAAIQLNMDVQHRDYLYLLGEMED